MTVSVLYTFKLSGRTAASTDGTAAGIIATKTVTITADNVLRFANASAGSPPYEIQLTGPVAQLFRELLTGTGGVATTSWLV